MAPLTGSLTHHSQYLAAAWQQKTMEATDSGVRAARYLQVMRDLAITPAWIGLSDYGADCSPALAWLGDHIDSLNRQLHSILLECLDCFHADQRPPVQIFAAPILPRAGIDGFCNLKVHPITLVVDPSRVDPQDWSHLVIHELAHSVTRSAGHGAEFRTALAHLCLALDLPEPPVNSSPELLRAWPPYRVSGQGTSFWHG
jgi:hypothetical protein